MEGQKNETMENQSAQLPSKENAEAIEPKKYKLKLDDKEEELTETDLAELVKAGRSANLSRKQVDEVRQQAEQLFKQLKENPRKTLSDPKLGLDFYKLAEEAILEKIQQDMLTPEQKKLREYEQRFKEIEDQEKTKKEKEEQDALAQAEAHWVQNYDKMFLDALNASALPKTPRTIKRMAEIASVKLEKGEEIDAKSLAQLVREDYLAEIKDLLGASDEDSLLQILGDEIGNKIRKADLKKLKATSHVAQVSVARPKTSSKSQPSRVSSDEWRERMERIKKGLE